MGNVQAKMYRQISVVLPGSQNSGWDSAKDRLCDKDNSEDAIIAVITKNGSLNLSEHEFRLLYGRRENGRIVARIVAQKEGVITAKIEPGDDGKDQVEAFKALRQHIERRLNRLLQELPDEEGETVAKSSSIPVRGNASVESAAAQVVSAPSGNIPTDAPPTYGIALRDQKSSFGTKKG